MKKEYIAPAMEMVELEYESLMLTGSYGNGIDEGVDVGGEILPGQSFDAKDRGGLFNYEW